MYKNFFLTNFVGYNDKLKSTIMEEAIYYIHVNGQQRGPFAMNQLLAEGLTQETMVWKNGMPNWTKASSLPELQSLFMSAPVSSMSYDQPSQYGQPQNYGSYGTPGSGYQQPQYGGQQSFGGGQMGGNVSRTETYPAGWTSWMGWAITGTVLCALSCTIFAILGIIGLVKSAQANQQIRYGDYIRAQATNNAARTWTIVSLIIGGLVILGLIISILSGAAAIYTLLNPLNYLDLY